MKNSTTKRCNPWRVHTSTVKKSAATISFQCRLRNSFQLVFRLRSAQVRCRAASGCWRWCRGPSYAPSSKVHPESVDSPNRDSLPPSGPPTLRSRRRCEAVPVHAGGCRHISVQSVSDARPTGFPVSRCSDLSQQSPPQSHSLGCQAAPLIVIQPKPSATKLLSKDSVLFAKVVNSVLLRLIHPSGHSDQHEPKWVEDSWRQQSPLSRPWSGDASDPALAIRSVFWTLRE